MGMNAFGERKDSMGKRPSRQPPRPATPRGRLGRRMLLVGGTAAGAVAIGSLFVGRDFGAATHAYALAPESALPPDIQRAPADVREAYRFAVANRETLRYIPCFCGCGADGHTSNASCYVKDGSAADRIEFERMSLG